MEVLIIKANNSENTLEVKNLCINLLKNVNSVLYNHLQELRIVIPNEKQIKLEKNDFFDIFDIVGKFTNLELLELGFSVIFYFIFIKKKKNFFFKIFIFKYIFFLLFIPPRIFFLIKKIIYFFF